METTFVKKNIPILDKPDHIQVCVPANDKPRLLVVRDGMSELLTISDKVAAELIAYGLPHGS